MSTSSTPTLTPAEEKMILVRAENLIASPENWVKGTSKRIESDGMVRYCAYGAVEEVVRETFSDALSNERHRITDAVFRLLSHLPRARERRSPSGSYGEDYRAIEYNDAEQTQHDEVIALFEEAIAEQRKKIEASL